MFPIRSVQGAVIGFGGRVLDRGEPKYLNSPETPVFVKGRELYGLFEARTAIRQRGYALVVEGYMDVVALAQSGFGNAVATLGTACTAEHVQKLVRFTDAVVFSFDGDAAGRRAAGRALEASLPHASDTRSFRFLFLPAEHDPDSYVRELGAEAFEQRVARRRAAVEPDRRRRPAKGCDLATAEGRARFLANVQPLWTALPDGMLKRQLLGEIASRAALASRRAGRALARRRGGARPAGAAAGAAGRPALRRRGGRSARPSASRTTGSPGCCCSKAPGGRRSSAADHAAALRPARLARRGCSASSTARPREHGAPALGGAARAGRRASPGATAALALVDGEDPAIEPLARRPAQLDGAAARRPTRSGPRRQVLGRAG